MAEDSDAADAARAQAEARRKRILEKADTRLGVVSGEQGQDEEAKKQSSIRAARLRAARQRRYGKKTAVTAESKMEESAAASTSETDEGSKATAEAASETKKENQNPSEATPKEETVQEVPGEAGKASAVSREVEAEGLKESPKEVPQKKYLGVARTRRKMIQKRKMAEAEDSGKLHSPSTKTDTDLPLKPLATQVATIPIYMYIVTILLLFLAGVDVGLQQYHEDVKIHNNLALNEYGIPLIHRSPWKDNRSGSGIKLLQTEPSPSPKTHDTFKDEFEEDLDDQDYVPNIDPVFGVDLDEVTKGPGLLNQLARGAIAVHRLVLMLVYYTPRNILQSLAGIPRALMQTPPALCLMAIVLRQLVGKLILKAGVPVPDVEEKDSAIDVLAMVKQYVTKFLSSTFPTAVGVYDAFVHLRSDMYIVICGVFCGMAWTHMSQYSHIAVEGLAAGGATDEL